MKQKSICFILPSHSDSPCGGYKIVYEYANRFSLDHFKVYIAYADFLTTFTEWKPISTFTKLKYLIKIALHYNQTNGWFKLNKNVKEKSIPEISTFWLPKSDYYIATAIDTSFFLDKLPFPSQKKFYFIQDFEFWNKTEKYVFDSYKLNLNKIVISPWLQEKVLEVNQKSILIPNGFDFNYFKLNVGIEDRNPHTISLLYHLDDRKRLSDAFAALQIVKQKDPKLSVLMFGTPDKPLNLPDWIQYFKKPNRETHNYIYNNTAIFISASKLEGFGLPLGEAMICGCAVCCTNNLGSNIFTINNETALVSEPLHPDELAENILKLVNNDSLRNKIAIAGNSIIKKFSWETSYPLFKQALIEKDS